MTRAAASGHRRQQRLRIGTRSAEIILVLAGLITAAVFYGDLAGQYLYNDDFEWLAAARFDMNAGNVLDFRVVNFFRPLINLSFYFQEQTFPGNLPLYYVTNIAMHVANAILAYLLLAAVLMDRRVAGCAAFLFLITSTHYTAVAWISARTTLLASFFLLSSLVVLLRSTGKRALPVALLLYVLALASKETAVVGLPMVILLFVHRRRGQGGLASRRAVVAFGIVTAVYMLARLFVIGRFAQGYWEPGLHAVRNVAGGFLYEVYPWWLVSLTNPGHGIAPPTYAIWPEVLAIPIIAVLLGVAHRFQRARQMGLLLGWALVALVPSSLFAFRFFSTEMVTQDRYYYLSSIGVMAAFALLLVGLWDLGRRSVPARALAIAVLAVMVTGEYRQVSFRNDRWGDFTTYYRALIDQTVGHVDQTTGMSVCVVQEPDPARPYVMQGLRMERPQWRVRQALSEEEAMTHRPCLYILVESDGRFTRMRSTEFR